MELDSLGPPRSGLLLEVDFRRLLQRCEEIVQGDWKGREDLQTWASSPAYHANVDLLQEQIADLSSLPPDRIDSRVIDSYQQHVKALVKKLQPIAAPSFVKAEPRKPAESGDLALGQARPRTASQATEMRQRTNVSLKAPLQKETREHLDRQANLQEDLTEEMVSLAASLKRNARAMQSAVQRRGGLLDETEDAVEASLIHAKKHRKEAQKMKVRGSISICTFLLLMAVTLMILAGTYMFIKTTSFFGYRRRP